MMVVVYGGVLDSCNLHCVVVVYIYYLIVLYYLLRVVVYIAIYTVFIAPCAGGDILPSNGTNTLLAHMVVSTSCNLCWWCFSFHQLVE